MIRIFQDRRIRLSQSEQSNETTVASLRGFLTECPPEEGRRYCIVMDNAPWHKKTRRLFRENKDGEFDDILEKAELLFLPPYSPDPNPIEQVWRITRRKKTHNRFFRCLEVLKDAVDGFIEELSDPNDLLRTLCTFHWMRRPGSLISS